jgi:hypothetical protein
MERFVSTTRKPVGEGIAEPRTSGNSQGNPPSQGSTYRPSQSRPPTQPSGWTDTNGPPSHLDLATEAKVQEEKVTEIVPKTLPDPVVRHHRWGIFWWGLRYFIIIIVVGVCLAIPIIVFRNDGAFEDEMTAAEKQYNNLLYYLFWWLEITWIAYFTTDIIALMLPYAFRLGMR